MRMENPLGRGRRIGKRLLVIVAVLLSQTVSAEVVYGLLPLRNETAGAGEAWVGLGLVLKLHDYLAAGQGAEFVPYSRLQEASGPSRADLSGPLEDERALRLAKAVGADCLLWGRYEVQGKTALCEIHLLHHGRRTRDTFKVSGRLSYFNALVRQVAEHVYRLQKRSVPARLRRQWLEERPLGEDYRYYVEARSPGREPASRAESLRRYLEHSPSDIRANLWLAEWIYPENTEEAIRIYQEVVQWDPGNGLAHANLGYLLAMREENPAARSSFKTATRCEGQYPQLYLNYGNLLRRLSLGTQAMRTYKEGVERFPEYAPLYFNLALLYDERKMSAEKAEAYQRAYELDPALRPDLFASRFYLEDQWIAMEED